MREKIERIERINPNTLFFSLLVIWFVINLIQALVLDVISDEAYYGLYGKFLDWGYYDHPPMVALLVKISSLLFNGNLGIRFMTVFLQPITLYIIWKIIDYKEIDYNKVVTFFIIAASVVMFAAYGFITAPDVPLLFFTALFLLAYKRFLQKEDIKSVLLLTISMAGLVYSKYQAVLVIGFVVLSNIGILKNYKFWTAGIGAVALLTPHIMWQISNGLPSFQYHLVARSSEFRLTYFFEYLPNELAVFNPFTLGAVVYLLVKYKPEDAFSRALYLEIIGFLLFFWVTAYRGHVEPHWTIACSIPMIILLSGRCNTDGKLMAYTRKWIYYSLALVLIARVFLVIDSPITRRIGYCGNGEKNEAIESVAGDLPVIFNGSFQGPSLYTFFTGKEAVTISSLNSRQTQFDIWQFEELYYNKPVFVCGNFEGFSTFYSSGNTAFEGFFANNLQTVNRIKLEYKFGEQILKPGETIQVEYSMVNTYPHSIDFRHEEFPVELVAVLGKGRQMTIVQGSIDMPINVVMSGTQVSGIFTFTVPDLPEGEYKIGFSLKNLFGPAMNSRFTKVNIGEHD